MTTRRPAAAVAAALLTALLLFFGGCAINPVSGRPDAVVITEKGEVEQGQAAAKEVEEQIGLIDDPELAAYVDGIGQRLAALSQRSHLEYTFQVVEMAEPNAFALPGGHIYVSRGLLALLNSESELANVIGHEIGHVAARHSVTRQTAHVPLIPVQIAAGLGGAAAGLVSPDLGRLIAGVGQLPGAFALAKYSRDQEREADRLGQEYANAGGWDPAGMASFMNSLGRDVALTHEDEDRVTFLDSHPPSPERSESAREYAATLERPAAEGVFLDHAAFLERLSGVVVDEGAHEGVFIGQRFLHPDLMVGFDLPAGWEYANTPEAVVAQRSDERAHIVFELAGKGDDPVAVARETTRQAGLRVKPKATRINGLPAAVAQVKTGRFRNRTRAVLTWIAANGVVYRITGSAYEVDFDGAEADLDAAATSFHVLSEEERAEVREKVLRIVAAAADESLSALGERTGNVWSLERTAVANGWEADPTLAEGTLVKIALPEPYVSREVPAPEKDAPADATPEATSTAAEGADS